MSYFVSFSSSFSSYSIYSISSISFFSSTFSLDEFSVPTGWIVLNFDNMVNMDVKLCKRVSKFKMSDSKAGLLARPKPPKICPDYISLTIGLSVEMFFFDMIDIDV